MSGNTRKLPIGMQDFEDIRREGYLYVDKTEYIYRLVNNGKPYFLKDKGYATPYEADMRTLIRVGVNFNSKEGNIDDWEVR